MELFEAQGSAGLEKRCTGGSLPIWSMPHPSCGLRTTAARIVLDKIAMKILHELHPGVKVTAIVRGEPVVNDADLDAARYVGLDRIVNVTGNGSGSPAQTLPISARRQNGLIRDADLIVSKGQGNFEPIHGCGLNILLSLPVQMRLVRTEVPGRTLSGDVYQRKIHFLNPFI